VDAAHVDAAAMDAGYLDARLAELYDVLNGWTPSDGVDRMAEFYLEFIMGAGSVLDVGCGTGELLCRARRAGHGGRLVGLDPAVAMLNIARAKRTDVGWLLGRAEALPVRGRFELIIMTGHAFQELLDDRHVGAVLAGFRRCLAAGGRLVFESRNPAARAWERWTPELTTMVVRSPRGLAYDVSIRTLGTPEPDLVDYVIRYRSRVSGETLASGGRIRFADREHLRALLVAAGLRIEATFGDWDRSEVGAASPEIIVVASAP